jgi:hypothetical protein
MDEAAQRLEESQGATHPQAVRLKMGEGFSTGGEKASPLVGTCSVPPKRDRRGKGAQYER